MHYPKRAAPFFVVRTLINSWFCCMHGYTVGGTEDTVQTRLYTNNVSDVSVLIGYPSTSRH